MKKQIIILLAAMSFLVSSCSKEEIQLNRNYFGVVQALKNGEKWNPYVYATHNVKETNYIHLEMTLYGEQNIRRETLLFQRIAKKGGYNSIKPKDTLEGFTDNNNIRRYSSYYLSNVDILCGSYQVDDSTEVAGYVNVTKYDEKSGILEGTFEVALVKNYNCEENSPDTLHFTEGVFSTKIQD